jgi:Arm DNA-binding domain
MAHHLIPSNATIKSIKAGDARHRLTDGAGLYLRLFVNGGSHGWRFDYSVNGRRNTLSLGTYPDTSLSLARKKADEARKLERQLSHAERNAVKAAYNHAEHLPVRRKMMQAWADHLDVLRKGGKVVSLRA